MVLEEVKLLQKNYSSPFLSLSVTASSPLSKTHGKSFPLSCVTFTILTHSYLSALINNTLKSICYCNLNNYTEDWNLSMAMAQKLITDGQSVSNNLKIPMPAIWWHRYFHLSILQQFILYQQLPTQIFPTRAVPLGLWWRVINQSATLLACDQFIPE